MQSILISGGTPLHGVIDISGAKNATLPIMACSILSSENLTLSNVPKLVDITTMQKLLCAHGAKIEPQEVKDSLTMTINCANIDNCTADYEIVSKMRASIWVLGPLLARFGHAEVSLPGGCTLGARQVDLHLAVLESMGAEIEVKNGYINATTNGNRKLHSTHFYFSKISVGATITGLMAATLAVGQTVLVNCAQEPEIVDLCECLNKMGAIITGIGTSEIHITGVSKLHSATHRVMSDRIEAGTYMIAAAITKGEIEVSGIDYHLVENLALKLREAGLEVIDKNTSVLVRYVGKLNAVDMQTQVYPGFATDLQAQFMSLMSVSSGVSVITENIFENRLMHVPELSRMGANITISNNHTAIVRGVERLNGAEVMASDLRASVSLILAGLAAFGETKVNRVYHLDRGYQSLEKKLSNCGANIKRI